MRNPALKSAAKHSKTLVEHIKAHHFVVVYTLICAGVGNHVLILLEGQDPRSVHKVFLILSSLSCPWVKLQKSSSQPDSISPANQTWITLGQSNIAMKHLMMLGFPHQGGTIVNTMFPHAMNNDIRKSRSSTRQEGSESIL